MIAPAGSGKTRVLTERLRLLIVQRAPTPGAVTALAYNTRAAEELRARASDVLAPDGPHVRTLNSLALWICNAFGPSGRVRVLEEPAVRDLVGELFEVKRQANTDTTAPYLAALSLVRLGLVSPDAAEEAYPDASGLAEGFDGFRADARRAGPGGLRRADLPGHRDPGRRPRPPGPPPRRAAAGCSSTSSRT